MPYFLGIDIGTSGTKVMAIDEKGTIAAKATVEYDLSTPQNGWAEQHPDMWWEAAVTTVREVAAQVNGDVAAIGLSGQMHGLVMLDEAGKVIRPALLWCDQRTAAECAEITEIIGAARLIELTANPALTGFTSPKILWVRKHEPDNYARCRAIMLPKDYIRFMLTGDNAGDLSDASGTGLLDVAHRCWCDEVLDKLNIDKALLGKLYESSEVTGTVTADAARLLGLPEGIPVVAGAGDNAAAAVGTGVVRDGRAFATIGSSGVVFAHTSGMAFDKAGRVHTFCSAVSGEWHVMGVMLSAGLSLKWLRDNCLADIVAEAEAQGIDPYVLMDKLAAQSPVGANRLLFLPYLNGERTPHLDPNARGAFVGLASLHSQSDLIRSVMEGVTYGLKDSLNIIYDMGTPINDMVACGGGGSSPFWRQLLADVFGCNVGTVQSNEGPALGAAILATVGAGYFPDVPTACDALVARSSQTEPSQEKTAEYAKYHTLFSKLYKSLKDDYKALAAL